MCNNYITIIRRHTLLPIQFINVLLLFLDARTKPKLHRDYN